MTRYYKVYVNTGFAGAKHVDIVKVEDDEFFPSEAELEEIAKDFLFESCEFGAFECDKDGKAITTPSE